MINTRLAAKQTVLWLLSGGSAISVAVEAASHVISDTSKLTVGLIDERYGPPAHSDSNWYQLESAGFKVTGAKMKPMITGLDVEQTADSYNHFIKSAANYDYRIGLLGIGTDGHIAGILPGSPALVSSKFVDFYQGPDYQRVTLTAKGLDRLDKVVVYAAGDGKKTALENLVRNLEPSQQPAQLLKRLDDVDVYNDVIGD